MTGDIFWSKISSRCSSSFKNLHTPRRRVGTTFSWWEERGRRTGPGEGGEGSGLLPPEQRNQGLLAAMATGLWLLRPSVDQLPLALNPPATLVGSVRPSPLKGSSLWPHAALGPSSLKTTRSMCRRGSCLGGWPANAFSWGGDGGGFEASVSYGFKPGGGWDSGNIKKGGKICDRTVPSAKDGDVL